MRAGPPVQIFVRHHARAAPVRHRPQHRRRRPLLVAAAISYIWPGASAGADRADDVPARVRTSQMQLRCDRRARPK